MPKYIMTDKGPIIFPDSYNHNDITVNQTIKGAGLFFAYGDPNNPDVCTPEGSMTLHISPDDNDKHRLARFIAGLVEDY